jgi:hypothetical protein
MVDEYIVSMKEKDGLIQKVLELTDEEITPSRYIFLKKDIYTKQLTSVPQRLLQMEQFLLKFWQKEKEIHRIENESS